MHTSLFIYTSFILGQGRGGLEYPTQLSSGCLLRPLVCQDAPRVTHSLVFGSQGKRLGFSVAEMGSRSWTSPWNQVIKKYKSEEESGLRSYCMQMTSSFIAQFPSIDTTSHARIIKVQCTHPVHYESRNSAALQKRAKGLSCCISPFGARVMIYLASC